MAIGGGDNDDDNDDSEDGPQSYQFYFSLLQRVISTCKSYDGDRKDILE